MSRIIKKKGGQDRLGQYAEVNEYLVTEYTWQSPVAGSPSSGNIEYDNITPANVTIVYISVTDLVGASQTAALLTIGSGDVLQLKDTDNSLSSIVFNVTGTPSLGGGNVAIPVTFNSSGTGADFVPEDNITFAIYKASGEISLNVEYTFDTDVTDSDPTAGKFKFNNVVFANATQIFMDILNDEGLDITIILSSLRTGDIIYFQQLSDPNKSVIYNVGGVSVDGTGYFKIPVIHSSSGTGGNIDNGALCGVIFQRSSGSKTIASGDTLIPNATDTLLATFTPLDNKVYRMTSPHFKPSDPPAVPIEIGEYETSSTSVGFGSYQLKGLTNGDIEARFAFSEGGMGVARNVVWSVKEEDL